MNDESKGPKTRTKRLSELVHKVGRVVGERYGKARRRRLAQCRKTYVKVLGSVSESRKVYNFEDARLDRDRLRDTSAGNAAQAVLKNHGLAGTAGFVAKGALPEDFYAPEVNKFTYNTKARVRSLRPRQVELFRQLFHHILKVTGSPYAHAHDATLHATEFEAYLRRRIRDVARGGRRLGDFLGDWKAAEVRRWDPDGRQVCCVAILDDAGTDPAVRWVHASQLRIVDDLALLIAGAKGASGDDDRSAKNTSVQERYPRGTVAEVQIEGKATRVWELVRAKIDSGITDRGMSFEGFCKMQATCCGAVEDKTRILMDYIDPQTFQAKYDWITPLLAATVGDHSASCCCDCDGLAPCASPPWSCCITPLDSSAVAAPHIILV